MKKFLIALAILFSFQIVHCQKAVKNLPKKLDSPATAPVTVVLIAPDTIQLFLTQEQFELIKQYLQISLANSREAVLLKKMEAEIKRQSKKKTMP